MKEGYKNNKKLTRLRGAAARKADRLATNKLIVSSIDCNAGRKVCFCQRKTVEVGE